MLTAIFALGVSLISGPKRVYRPFQAVFWVQFSGDPCDQAQSDVSIRCTRGKDDPITSPAYFDCGAWKAWILPPQIGEYSVQLIHNGIPSVEPHEPFYVLEVDELIKGFSKVAPSFPNRFYEFYPIGWKTTDIESLKTASCSWTRIAVASDEDEAEVDALLSRCQRSGICVSLRIDPEGGLSGEVHLRQLRRRVLRWGSNPSVMSWELMEPRGAKPEGFDEAVALIRKLDPVGRPIAGIDYQYQSEASSLLADKTPSFVGSLQCEASTLRDSLWNAVLSNQSGAPCLTSDLPNAKHEYGLLAKAISLVDLAQQHDARVLLVSRVPGAGRAIGTIDWALVRFVGCATMMQFQINGLANGTYLATVIDLETGKTTEQAVSIVDSIASIKVVESRDFAVVLKRQ